MSGVALGAALIFGMPAIAAPIGGDGSDASNPDLLRGSYDSGCTNALICDSHNVKAKAPAAGSSGPATVGGPLTLEGTMEAQPPATDQPAVLADPAVSRQAPAEAQPQLEADWSVSLRGTYDQGSRGTRFGVVLAPEVSVVRKTVRGELGASADAELVREDGDTYRLSSTRLEFTGTHALDSTTELAGGANLSVSQQGTSDLDVASNVTQTPTVVSGTVNGGISRRFGRFTAAVQGNATRDYYGATVYAGGTVSDNSDLDRTGLGGAARISYDLTDRVNVFAEASADRDIYDAASPGKGVAYNSWTYALRGGVSADWDGVVSAEISAGYGVRQFDSNLLDDAPTALMDARLTYRPDETLAFTALFSTAYATPDAATGASAEIDYTASAQARYTVNDLMAVHGSVGAKWVGYSDIDDTSTTYSAGLGANFTMSEHTSVNADYAYEVRNATGSDQEDNQTVTLGVTLSR